MLRRFVSGQTLSGFHCWLKVSVAALGGILLSGTTNGVLRAMSGMARTPNRGGLSAAFVTCPSEDVAKKLSRAMVEKDLAACVNIIPKVTSVYRWEGKVQEDSETLLMIKTRTEAVSQLIEFVKSNHPYDVPEVISVQLNEGNEAYMQWVRDSVKLPAATE